MPNSRPAPDHPGSLQRLRGALPALAAVAAGGLAGSAARIAIGIWLGGDDHGFPVDTLVVNLAGSLLLGLFLARRERAVSRRHSVQFWAIGVFGSFTTFSTFSVEIVQLLSIGRAATAAGYLTASLVGGLVSALAGLRIGELAV